MIISVVVVVVVVVVTVAVFLAVTLLLSFASPAIGHWGTFALFSVSGLKDEKLIKKANLHEK